MVVPLLAILALVPAARAAAGPGSTPLPRTAVDRPFAISPGAAGRPTAQIAAIRKRTWVSGVQVTEYWPVPEAWFIGKAVHAPGLSRRSRIDWLYSARGISMEGDGIGLDGQHYHIDALGNAGWIDRQGATTALGRGGWSDGAPWWRNAHVWFDRKGRPTFPMPDGTWYRGVGRRYVEDKGITFAPGPSRALSYYSSIAVDPSLIPLGSRVYIPAYKGVNGGWFTAADVGGAISSRHVDVYRPPPATPFGDGRSLADQRILVDPPGKG